jgi:hypothetical protein
MVWPVTSTLMISKIAVLCMMTRGHETKKEEEKERAATEAGGGAGTASLAMTMNGDVSEGGLSDVSAGGLLRPVIELMGKLDLLQRLGCTC